MHSPESDIARSSQDDVRWTALAAPRCRGRRTVRLRGADDRDLLPSELLGAPAPTGRNVSFHASCSDAEAAGFRPCRRCRPNEPSRAERQAEAVARACRLIEEAEAVPPSTPWRRRSG